VIVRHVGRLALAATSAALGVHPDALRFGAAVDALRLGAALVTARAGTPVAAWRRVFLSWPPARPARVAGGGPAVRRGPKAW
jgi:hypothetical protein